MHNNIRVPAMIAALLFIGCVIVPVTALSIVPAWTVSSPDENPVRGISVSDDGSRFLVLGSRLMMLSGEGKTLWSREAGGVAAMSRNGAYVVTASGESLKLLDRNGETLWIQNVGAPINVVSISPDGSIVASDDSRGYLIVYNKGGTLVGRARMDPATNIAVVPTADMVVIASDAGLRFVNPGSDLLWTDNRSGSLETLIACSADGSIIYTAGGNRVSSHSRTGTLNWQKEVTTEAIMEMVCSAAGDVIVLGSQDKNVYVLDASGTTREKYPVGKWINAVSVSRDGSLVAAGDTDRYLTVFFRNGTLVGTVRAARIIQPHSVAISPAGNRVVIGDEIAVYGYTIGANLKSVEETATPRRTVTRTSVTTPVPVITAELTELPTPEVSVTEDQPEMAATTTTKQSPLSLMTFICAGVILAVVFRRRA